MISYWKFKIEPKSIRNVHILGQEKQNVPTLGGNFAGQELQHKIHVFLYLAVGSGSSCFKNTRPTLSLADWQ